jgi:competence protein ComEA
MITIRRFDIVRPALFAAACALVLSTIVPSAPAFAADSPSGKIVNVNTASVEQLSNLPRIGTKLAERIVDFRKTNGSFKKVDELLAVKGIGEKMLEVLKPYVAVSGNTTLDEKISSGKGKSKKGAAKSPKSTEEPRG